MAITAEIHDEEGRSLLDTIDEIRQLAKIPHQIELPQIIVVGQQSSGKSSVLRAVSRIPFPTESGLCTQFAIEICCRRSDDVRTAARIGPSGSVDQEKLRRLDDFAVRWERASIDTEDQVRTMIEEARIAMGLQATKGYSSDRLIVEIQGPSQEHLTIIDLPGLINSGGEAEIDQVTGLVERYLKQANTIILAVIHGFSDGSNQRIFDLEPEYWRRAIGVITAADMIDWAGNGGKNIKFGVSTSGRLRPRYGWHIVRNLNSEQTRLGMDRDKVENEFFDGKVGTPEWKGMERVLCGIEPLRQKLSKTLKELIASFLPAMLGQVESAIVQSKIKLRALGDERSNNLQQRAYLVKNAGILGDRLRNSLEGRAEALDIAFDGISLRDQVRSENEQFADDMIDKGHTWKIEASEVIEDLEEQDAEYEDDPSEALKFKGTEHLAPYSVSKDALLHYFTRAISQRPGRALRGTFDPIWVGTFFLQQSYKWQVLVEAHAAKVFDIVATEVRSSVYACLNEDTADALLEQMFEPNLRERHQNLQSKIQELLTPYTSQFPATLNRGYTRTLLRGTVNTQGITFNSKDQNDEVDLQLQAAAHICRCMESYYDVAINVLLDNVQSLGIENVLLKELDKIFVPESIAEMDAHRVERLAGESPEKADERKELTESIHDFERAKQIIVKQRSRSFAAVSTSTSPRPQSQPTKASHEVNGTTKSVTMPNTRDVHSQRNGIEELDGDQGTLPRYPTLSNNLSSPDGQKTRTKTKLRQAKPLNKVVNGEND